MEVWVSRMDLNFFLDGEAGGGAQSSDRAIPATGIIGAQVLRSFLSNFNSNPKLDASTEYSTVHT